MINEDRWNLAQGNFTEIVLYITHYKLFENCIFENIATSSWGNMWTQFSLNPFGGDFADDDFKSVLDWNVRISTKL